MLRTVFYSLLLTFVTGAAQAEAKEVLVEVHESIAGGRIWCHVGVVEATQSIAWGPSQEIGQGRTPMAAAEGLAVVEVHQGVDDTELYYRVGKVDLKSMRVSWGEETRFDRGQRPNVAIRDGVVIEVHQSHTGANLWYHVGKMDLDNRAVKWGPSRKYDRGSLPSVGF